MAKQTTTTTKGTVTIPLTALMLPEGIQPTGVAIIDNRLVVEHAGAEIYGASVHRSPSSEAVVVRYHQQTQE